MNRQPGFSSMITQDRLQIRQWIRGSRAKVWDAWTQPEIMRLWGCPEGMQITLQEHDFRVGGKYRNRMEGPDGVFTHHGVMKEIVPLEKLVYTFEWEGDDPVETLVTIELIDKDGGTEVILTQERFVDPEEPALHAQGWKSSLSRLAQRFQ